ncbi:hypothetical protein BRC81_14880 [Halobacteriales archaeon QS_1_68_20]|nr:MAG: hypothetical protein BRC81_14880 [Halobacteriales archaeon QS_1_68_20]
MDVLGHEVEPRRPEVLVEREDVIDVMFVGENAADVVDEGDLLIVAGGELVGGRFERRSIRNSLDRR